MLVKKLTPVFAVKYRKVSLAICPDNQAGNPRSRLEIHPGSWGRPIGWATGRRNCYALSCHLLAASFNPPLQHIEDT